MVSLSRTLAVAVVGALAFAPVVLSPSGAHAWRESGANTHRETETLRIQAHFDSVIAELRSRDVSALGVEQRARRDALVGTLRVYRDRGEFPNNHDFPGEAVPYFVDRGTGVLCAVAHLLESSDRRDIVDRVANANNNVWVPDLSADTAFTTWLDTQGLALAEAARIQVPYIGEDRATPARQAQNVSFGAVALGTSIAASIWNARSNSDGHRRIVSAVGLVSGLATAGASAALMPEWSTQQQVVGAAGILIGGTGVALAVRSMIGRNRATKRVRSLESAGAHPTITIAPMLAGGSDGGAGMTVSIRF